MIIIKLIVALIWAIVGLLIWIPILIRMMFFYISIVCYYTIMEWEIKATKLISLLENTASIYRNGFENIFNENDRKIIQRKDANSKKEIWGELLWALIFWGTIIIPFLDIKAVI